MMKRVDMAIGVVLLCAIGFVGYRLALSRVEVDIYRDRLVSLSNDYETLRANYNQAVARTAVTELVVKDGKLSVTVRTIQGVERTLAAPFDPSQEIYCDYVLLEGRMWIRRVYDAQTPPSKGLVIDDSLRTIDWTSPAARYGQAVYRSLSEGRWIITVTGDGSLGLAKTDEKTRVTLSGPPPVRQYDQIKEEIDKSISDVTAGDVAKRLIAPSK